jgi:hypothetical protein
MLGLLVLIATSAVLLIVLGLEAMRNRALYLDWEVTLAQTWGTLLGGCLPLMMAVVFWLLPLLKEVPDSDRLPYWLPLLLLVPGTLLMLAEPIVHYVGYNALAVLPVVWACFLGAGLFYAYVVWRLGPRHSLHPTTCDFGMQAGVIWLVSVLVLRLAFALIAVDLRRYDLLASAEQGWLAMMLFGFLGNTGLALASVAAPEFLQTPKGRPGVINAFVGYNVMLLFWVIGAAWCLTYPYSWGRLPFFLVSLGFFGATLNLLAQSRLLAVIFRAHVNTPRRRFARSAISLALISLLVAALAILLIASWVAGSQQLPPSQLLDLPYTFMTYGFLLSLALGLFAALLGRPCLEEGRNILAYGACAMLGGYLALYLMVNVAEVAADRSFNTVQAFVALPLEGALMVMLLWLTTAFGALRGSDS